MTKLAVYPGSFDPVTLGHLDIIKRSRQVFDKLIVAVAVNPRKNPLFTAEERVEMIRQSLRKDLKIEVETFEGLLTNYIKRKKANVVIRGLRALSDFDYEFQMALTNRKLLPGVDTFFLMASEPHIFMSSGLIKEIAYFGGDINYMVPKNVEKKLKAKRGKIPTQNLG